MRTFTKSNKEVVESNRLSDEEVKKLREKYPKGTRIRLIHMSEEIAQAVPYCYECWLYRNNSYGMGDRVFAWINPRSWWIRDRRLRRQLMLVGDLIYNDDFLVNTNVAVFDSRRDGWHKPQAAILDLKIKYITTDDNCIIIEGKREINSGFPRSFSLEKFLCRNLQIY